MTLQANIVRRSYPLITDTKTRDIIQLVEVVKPARVISRFRDGLSQLAPLDGSCPTRSTGIQSEAIGEVVVVPGTNFQQIGSTGLGATIIGAGTAWLERQEPVLMDIGETTMVIYYGGGFNENFVIDYLLPRRFWTDPAVPELHPNILPIADYVVINTATATANVTVNTGAIWDTDPMTGQPVLGPVQFSFTGR